MTSLFKDTPSNSIDSVKIFSKFTLRPLFSHQDFVQCVRLQHLIWGKHDHGIIQESTLKINQSIGGLSAGVFDSRDTLLGFIYSCPGWVNRAPIHWSLRLGIHPNYRNLKIGRHLKQYQKSACLTLGIHSILWTFDPLESHNAHFNLHTLGGQITEYVTDLYPHSNSSLHKGFHTDRFVLKWDLQTPSFYEPSMPTPHISEYRGEDESGPAPDLFKVKIPKDIQKLKKADPKLASTFSHRIRNIFSHLHPSFRVINIVKSPDSDAYYYIVERRSNDSTSDA